MSDPDAKLKKQRDQFLAFAFASADLFLEISESGKITFALGASKGMTGITDKEMMGMNWLSLFSAFDQAKLIDRLENARLGKRWGPELVDLNEDIIKRKGIITGIKMPGM
ncbi:MAG: PAS domain-containing protein, partial [Micavibrio sp.]|nr:PAS domain-containing protein [Micavibrio sp.]